MNTLGHSPRDYRALAIALLAIALTDLALVLGHARPDVYSIFVYLWLGAALVAFSVGYIYLAAKMRLGHPRGAKLGFSSAILNLLPLLLQPPSSVAAAYLAIAGGAALYGAYSLMITSRNRNHPL